MFNPLRKYAVEADLLSKKISESEAKMPLGWCGDGLARGELDWLREKAKEQEQFNRFLKDFASRFRLFR